MFFSLNRMGRRTNKQHVTVHYDDDTNSYTVKRPDGLPTSRTTQKLHERAIKFVLKPMTTNNDRVNIIRTRLLKKLTQKQN